MADITEMIRDTIAVIEETYSADLIIYDTYGMFLETEIVKFSQYNRWHVIEYCLHIKSNPQLFNKCKFIKSRVLKKTDYDNTVLKTTCFCGVTEYNIPIKVNNDYIGLITLTGFRGEIKDNLFKKCAKVLGYTPEKFVEVREKELVSTDKEKHIIIMLKTLAHLFDEFIDQNIDFLNETTTKNPHVIRALEYIKLNYNRQIRVSQVANACYISVPYLQSLFSHFLGHGIAEEIRKHQLDNAKVLLSKTEYSVRYISHLCGFKSPDYFCTVFKREEKISPLKYRRINRISK